MRVFFVQVLQWAKQQFELETHSSKPDHTINLAKACLLIALEEEAAIMLHSHPATLTTDARSATVLCMMLGALLQLSYCSV